MPATTVENSFICIFSKQFVFSLPQAINKKLISNKKKEKEQNHTYVHQPHRHLVCWTAGGRREVGWEMRLQVGGR